MSAADNRALLEEYLNDIWVGRDPGAIERFVAPDYQRHMSPTAPPLDALSQIERIKGFQAAFPDISFTLEHVIAGDEGLAFHGTMRGTHTGEFLGIPPTNKTFEIHLVDFMWIEDGKIVEQWGGPDMLDMARQLGASITAGE